MGWMSWDHWDGRQHWKLVASPALQPRSDAEPAFCMKLVLNGLGYNEDAGHWRVDTHPRLLADTTGDGRADIVGFGGPGVYVACQNPEGQRCMDYTRDILVAAPDNGRVRWGRTPY